MRIVIAGAGSVGCFLLERLAAESHDIVIIDQREDILAGLSARFDIQTLIGNASVLETLVTADVAHADIFLAVTDSDETNLISCLLADSLKPDLRKIARIRELVADSSGLSHRIADVFDHFINPDLEAVNFLLRLFEAGGGVELMEFGDGRIWVLGLVLDEESPVLGVKLKDLSESIDKVQDVLIVAIVRHGNIIIPRGHNKLEAGDTVYVAAPAHRYQNVFSVFGSRTAPVKHVMINGGSGIGRKLAQALAERDVKVKLIDPDAAACETLAARLSNVLVLNGDGTDQELLREEGIEDVNVFVGATDDDEENILSAVLAKRLGVQMVSAVVHKTSYLRLAPELGVDIVVSPHLLAASTMLRFVRGGVVSSAFSTRDDSAEVLEVVATEGSSIVGKPLRDINLPDGVIVAALLDEEEATVPFGDSIIDPGTHVIFFASRAALPRLELLLGS